MSFILPRTSAFLFSCLGALAIAAGCGSDDSSTETTGQPTGTGGSSAGGSANGGSANGGSASGGMDTGGASAGGMSAGGGGGDGCGAIGTACNGSCPDGLTCYSEGSAGAFCIPPAGECGGFAGEVCGARTPVCMTLAASDFGPCGTQTTKECVCANAPGAIDDC